MATDDAHDPSAPSGNGFLANWRDYLGEIAVIVVGILIASGIERWFDARHEASVVAQLHDALRAEAALSTGAFRWRIDAGPCIEARLDALEAEIEKATAGKAAPPVVSVAPPIGPPIIDSVWQARRASPEMAALDSGELRRIAAYFDQIPATRQLLDAEFTDWRSLRVLAGDTSRLGAPDFALLRAALASARSLNHRLVTVGERQLAMAQTLNLRIEPQDKAALTAICAPADRPPRQ